LEGRLAPSAVAPAVTPPATVPADVNQQGNFDGQFGDQTTVDGPQGADTGGTAATPGGTSVNTEVDL
jgi:hypothetical protein